MQAPMPCRARSPPAWLQYGAVVGGSSGALVLSASMAVRLGERGALAALVRMFGFNLRHLLLQGGRASWPLCSTRATEHPLVLPVDAYLLAAAMVAPVRYQNACAASRGGSFRWWPLRSGVLSAEEEGTKIKRLSISRINRKKVKE